MCKINKGFAADGKGRIVNTVPSQSAEEQINILLPFCFFIGFTLIQNSIIIYAALAYYCSFVSILFYSLCYLNRKVYNYTILL